VRLVSGEDRRYTLEAPGLEDWLASWLGGLDGRRTLEQALADLPPAHREQGRQLVSRLYGERVVLDATAAGAHRPAVWSLRPEGTGRLADALRACAGSRPARPATLPALGQDRLDYDEALRFNRRCLGGPTPWLWLTCGPGGRGYVSPGFLPDAGPCLECLLRAFQRLSPAPEFYDELMAHAQAGGSIAPAPFDEQGLQVLCQLALWKAALLAEDPTPAAPYQLHVLEVASLEVTAHRVFTDPECPACQARR
jgi:bacteriocin biosynthesis cyclodehydratase domain-containing protein